LCRAVKVDVSNYWNRKCNYLKLFVIVASIKITVEWDMALRNVVEKLTLMIYLTVIG
jgi:hypothetical protein